VASSVASKTSSASTAASSTGAANAMAVPAGVIFGGALAVAGLL
jgi:hypothetical protein